MNMPCKLLAAAMLATGAAAFAAPAGAAPIAAPSSLRASGRSFPGYLDAVDPTTNVDLIDDDREIQPTDLG